MTTLECAIRDAENPEVIEVLKALAQNEELFINQEEDEFEQV